MTIDYKYRYVTALLDIGQYDKYEGAAMRFHETLEDVLGSKIKIRILRLYYRTKGSYSGREVARLIDYSQEATRIALHDLMEQGLLKRDYAGTSYIFTLNEEHMLFSKVIKRAFIAEQNSLIEIVKIFKELLGKEFVRAVVFGSVARGEERPDSDIDILVVIKDSADIDALEDDVNNAATLSTAASGNPVMPIVIKAGEYEKKSRSKRKQGIWGEIFDRNRSITYTREDIEAYGQEDQQKARQ
jgi:predicted nucleotidyltransferase